jgi:formate dehydrogenase subunit delta
MTVDALVRMANQIAANQAHLSDDQAVAAVAKHLKSFWAYSMQRDLLDAVAAGTVDLDPIALRAVEQLQPA